MSIGGDLINSVLGNAEKAIIVCYDYRASSESRASQSALGSVAAKAAQAALDALPACDELFTGLACVKRQFRVQFNPSELQLYSASETIAVMSATGKGGAVREADDGVLPGKMELTVNLYFDDENHADAFVEDKTAVISKFGTASGVSSAVSMVRGIMGKTWSVQPQVEAFIAAIRNKYTQKISFNWQDFEFPGYLKNITAQYTMFSTSGNPIRAKVMLRLRLAEDKISCQSWINNLNKLFSLSNSSMVSGLQKQGGLLNFNI